MRLLSYLLRLTASWTGFLSYIRTDVRHLCLRISIDYVYLPNHPSFSIIVCATTECVRLCCCYYDNCSVCMCVCVCEREKTNMPVIASPWTIVSLFCHNTHLYTIFYINNNATICTIYTIGQYAASNGSIYSADSTSTIVRHVCTVMSDKRPPYEKSSVARDTPQLRRQSLDIHLQFRHVRRGRRCHLCVLGDD